MDKYDVLVVINSAPYCLTHRVELIQTLERAGLKVAVVIPQEPGYEKIKRLGFHCLPFEISRAGKNPFNDLKMMWQLHRLYRTHQPKLVHHFTIKPVIFGTLAARLAGVQHILNSITGLGYMFTHNEKRHGLLRKLVCRLYRFSLYRAGSWVLFQNKDDQAFFIERGLIPADRCRLIRGSGVDPAKYAYQPMPAVTEAPIVMCLARMIRDKGIEEFVRAAKQMKALCPRLVRFVLVGDNDPANPTSISRTQLQAWHDAGVVEWWGYQEDVRASLRQATIVCLPTIYREGVPKALLEAASVGRPIVTTDMPGCREAVTDGVNGRLIPVAKLDQLAHYLLELLAQLSQCEAYGRAGRARVIEHFSLQRVLKDTITVYEQCLQRRLEHGVPVSAAKLESVTEEPALAGEMS